MLVSPESNHVHLILTPKTPEGLGRALGKAPSALFRLRQRAQPRARPSLPGALFLGRDGRGTPDGGGALCGDESGQGAAGRARRGLAVVERAGASGRPRRRLVEGRAAAFVLRRALRRPEGGRGL